MRSTSLCSQSVSIAAFRDALISVWGHPFKSKSAVSSSPRAFGLAVSGGVDSMALAHLSRQLEKMEPHSWQFTAFVVDHSARKNSDIEAKSVVRRLQEMGLKSFSIALKWPENVRPEELSNFETQARSLRYQALGLACSERDISGLLLAHHNDDQVETVILRIIGGYRGAGLHGMKKVANVPECEGIWGVYQGAWERACQKDSRLATEGLRVYRPLMRFGKADLIDTCKEAQIDWAEDPTNFDLSLTPRNAIRSLLEFGRLPHALNKTAIRKIGDTWDCKLWKADETALHVFQTLNGVSLDLRSGKLEIAGDLPGNLDGLTKMRLAKQLAETISPNSRVTPRHLRQIVKFEQTLTAPETVFNGAHLSWRRRESSGMITWCIAREPFYSSQTGHLCYWTKAPLEKSSRIGSWQLFDGRFWLRITRLGNYPSLVARSLTPELLREFLRSMPWRDRSRLEQDLKIAAPGKVRWTLPVLTTEDEKTPVALPTFDVQVPSTNRSLGFTVKFKHIDPKILDYVKLLPG